MLLPGSGRLSGIIIMIILVLLEAIKYLNNNPESGDEHWNTQRQCYSDGNHRPIVENVSILWRANGGNDAKV